MSVRRHLKVAHISGRIAAKEFLTKCHGGLGERSKSILSSFFPAEPGAVDLMEAAL